MTTEYTASVVFQSAGTSGDQLLQRYVEQVHNCKWGWNHSSLSPARQCEALTETELSAQLQIAPEVPVLFL